MHIRNTIFALAMLACGALTASPAAPPAASQAAPARDSHPPAQTDEQRGMAEAGQRWAGQGVKVGAFLDDVSVYTLEGKGTQARFALEGPADAAGHRFAHLPSRAAPQCPSLRSIIEAHDPEVRTVLLYTIEAHPQVDESPYRPGREWVTPQNEKAGVLHRQPRKLEDRLPLARDMHEQLGEVAPMLVDGMDNSAWKSLGGGPNMAVLIDSDGKVIAKQGWLDSGAMATGDRCAPEGSATIAALAEYETSKKARPQMEAFIEAVNKGETSTRRKSSSRRTRASGSIRRPARAIRWASARGVNGIKRSQRASRCVESAVIDVHSRDHHRARNQRLLAPDRLSQAGAPNPTYWFDDRGPDNRASCTSRIDVTPSFRECFKPALDWMTATKPEELRAIYPGNDFAPSADTAQRWREALITWRAATGRAAIELAK